jgi:hypothetical protein
VYTINRYNVAQIIIKAYSIQLHKLNIKINLPLNKENIPEFWGENKGNYWKVSDWQIFKSVDSKGF